MVPLHRIELAPQASGPGPARTIVLLHGYGANEHDLLALGHALDPSLRVVSLAAPLTLPWGGRAWYHLGQEGGAISFDPGAVQEAAAIARAEVDAIAAQAGPVLLLGFSQGGGMALMAALASPRSVRAVFGLSAVPPDRGGKAAVDPAVKGLPVFLGHGTRDPLLPIDYGRHSRALLEEAGCNVTYREYPMGHEISERELGDLAAFLRGLGPAQAG
jgi:phospholipase/carboxylesterase